MSPRAVLAIALLAAGCGGEIPGAGTGSVVVAVSVAAEGEPAVAVAAVTARAIALDGDLLLAQDLTRDGARWVGELSELPGEDVTLGIAALDAGGEVVAARRIDGLQIPAGRAALLLVPLEVSPAPRSPGATGRVAFLAASAAVPVPGERVLLRAGFDGQAPSGGPIWSASTGHLEKSNATTTTWIAPDAEQEVLISLGQKNLAGLLGGMSVQIGVNGNGNSGGWKPKTGKASVSVSFNNWPLVSMAAAQVGQLLPGQSSGLSVTASDSDGDPLTYAWSNSGGASACAGSFSGGATATPTWTAPATAPAPGQCQLRVDVSDGQGGLGSGILTVHVGAAPTVDRAPVIHSVFQSALSASAGDEIVLRVVASDPEGQALSFGWSATGGTLTAAVTVSGPVTTSSQVKWTLPASSPLPTWAYQVVMLVRDANNQATSHPFRLPPPGS